MVDQQTKRKNQNSSSSDSFNSFSLSAAIPFGGPISGMVTTSSSSPLPYENGKNLLTDLYRVRFFRLLIRTQQSFQATSNRAIRTINTAATSKTTTPVCEFTNTTIVCVGQLTPESCVAPLPALQGVVLRLVVACERWNSGQ